MSENSSKILSKSFIENHENVSEDVASDLLVKSELKIKQILEEKAADVKLNAAKEIARDLNAGYAAAIKYEKAKIAFLLDKISEIQNNEVNPTSSLK